ncbi:Ribosomal RNA large subunit methyltransferase J [compost metagenome]
MSSWKLARTVLDKVPSLSMLLCDNSPDVAKFLKPISDRDAIFDYHCGDGYKYVKSLSTQKLDFVFIDPPYKTDKSEKVSRDWAEVIKLAEYLKSKEVPFVVWYPIFTDKNPKMLQAKLGLPCLELLDNSFVTDDGLVGNNRQLKGAGMLFGGISESYIKSLTKLLNTELFVFGEVTFKN